MLFFTYEQARMFLTHQSGGNFTLAHVAQAGALAGLGTTLVLTPVGASMAVRSRPRPCRAGGPVADDALVAARADRVDQVQAADSRLQLDRPGDGDRHRAQGDSRRRHARSVQRRRRVSEEARRSLSATRIADAGRQRVTPAQHRVSRDSWQLLLVLHVSAARAHQRPSVAALIAMHALAATRQCRARCSGATQRCRASRRRRSRLGRWRTGRSARARARASCVRRLTSPRVSGDSRRRLGGRRLLGRAVSI